MKKQLNLLKLLFLIAVTFLIPLISLAQQLPELLQVVTDVADTAQLLRTDNLTSQQVIINGLNYLLGFLGIFFIISIIWAGWQWMSSLGEEEKIKKAKARLKNSLIGLIIILLSFALTAYLTNLYYKATCSGGYYCPSSNPNPSGECTNDRDCERQFGSNLWKCDMLEGHNYGSCIFDP